MSIPNYQLYRHPAAPAKAFFHVLPLEQFTRREGNCHHLHRHPSLFQLTYVTGGSGTHYIEEMQFDLVMGKLYLLRPGVVHACDSRGLMGYVLHFSADVLSESLRLSLDQQYYVSSCPKTGQRLIDGIFCQLCEHLSTMLTHKLLEVLVMLLLEHKDLRAGPQVQKSSHHLAHRFVALAEIYYPLHRNLDWYATNLHCSKNHLGTCVRAQLGRSPGKYLNDLVLADARHRLSLETTSVSSIAAELGFSDVDYFWRFFKKHTGQTPLTYRKSQKDPRNIRNWGA